MPNLGSSKGNSPVSWIFPLDIELEKPKAVALVLSSAPGEEGRKRRRTDSLITRLHGIWEERFGNGRYKLSWLQDT